MSKSGVEAFIYLDFYSDEFYTEDEINKITVVDCSNATVEIPADIKKEIDIDIDKSDFCTVFDSLEDYAIYEVHNGWYSGCVDLNVDYHGAPNLSYYIDYKGENENLHKRRRSAKRHCRIH